MNLLELIQKIGVENISFQKLNDCIAGNVTTNQKGVTKITIATDAINCSNVVLGTGPVGIILWLPRDRFNEAFKEKPTHYPECPANSGAPVCTCGGRSA